MQVHFTVASQFYVYANVEFHVHINAELFLHAYTQIYGGEKTGMLNFFFRHYRHVYNYFCFVVNELGHPDACVLSAGMFIISA